ncbi:LysR substrate-binding domain-containing protein (plasmid) [Paraburkholderia sp. D15]|uniref:LysR substrate-binding domain-containing protein n=1 Tax=Paraburkholderia sp. D15 TaxID=2880218 RepID=UPI0024796B1F|nr:LysR substrate-binding domain-containing protein [Paraburkholderia sp. D15]WGS55173.1 LysR substrate-binding domain-containing protein [Paraburkholderia sp. D15]
MDLRQLRYFLAVAQEAHFGRAAERLHIVQPALSMQIRALEDELGGSLLTRTSRRVELTKAGRLFQIEARRALDQAEYAKQAVQRAMRGETGRVRVGYAGNAVLSGKLMGDLRGFHLSYPDAELVVHEMASQAQIEAILGGQLDIGYAPGHGATLSAALVAETAGVWRFVVAMPSGHTLAKRKRISVPLLATEPLILYAAPDTEDSLLPALRAELGHEPRIAHRAASTLGVLALAASGLGLALVPQPLANVAIPDLVYRPLDASSLTADLTLLSRVDESGGAVNAFLSLAREGIKKRGA